ncbi:hypothetical protein ACCS55_15945 [Rhizobium ruizarguesonis]
MTMQFFVSKALKSSRDVSNHAWVTSEIVEIERAEKQAFRAAVISKKMVFLDHVEPFAESGVEVIVNFPKVGMWRADAIEYCEASGIAWGRYGVLLRALDADFPGESRDPQIQFPRRALLQHTRVKQVGFINDQLLTVRHDTGKVIRIALVYDYDLAPEDIRNARERVGEFDLVLKNNPNGSILDGVAEAAESMGAAVFEIKDLLKYLGRLK